MIFFKNTNNNEENITPYSMINFTNFIMQYEFIAHWQAIIDRIQNHNLKDDKSRRVNISLLNYRGGEKLPTKIQKLLSIDLKTNNWWQKPRETHFLDVARTLDLDNEMNRYSINKKEHSAKPANNLAGSSPCNKQALTYCWLQWNIAFI